VERSAEIEHARQQGRDANYRHDNAGRALNRQQAGGNQHNTCHDTDDPTSGRRHELDEGNHVLRGFQPGDVGLQMFWGAAGGRRQGGWTDPPSPQRITERA